MSKPRDIKITHVKGGGPGGQNRNKRMSGVRVEHEPSGLAVRATERRSQKQNLSSALERLEEKLTRLSYRPKKRTKTQPTRSSQRVRLDSKRKTSAKKRLRIKRNDQWDE